MRHMWLGLVLMTLLVTPGCEKPSKAQLLNAVKIAGREGTQYGLFELAKKDAVAAVEASKKLAKSLDEQILPYLRGEGRLASSALIQEFINSSLLKGELHRDVRRAIVAASVVLDLYLPVPGSDKLKPEQLEYMLAFFTGVREGCELADIKAPSKRVWLKE